MTKFAARAINSQTIINLLLQNEGLGSLTCIASGARSMFATRLTSLSYLIEWGGDRMAINGENLLGIGKWTELCL